MRIAELGIADQRAGRSGSGRSDQLAVDDPENNPLPEGETSVLALAPDAAARQEFINELYENNHDAFVAAQVAIAQDPDLAQPLENSVIEAISSE